MAHAQRNHDVPRRIGVREFGGDLTNILQQVREGSSFLVTSEGEVLAEVRPPPQTFRADRKPGALRGRLTMAADFDTLPLDVLGAMEGDAA